MWWLKNKNNAKHGLSIYVETNKHKILFDTTWNDLFIKNKMDIKNVLNIYISEVIIAAVKRDLGIGYVIKNLVENEKDLEILNVKEKLPSVMINLIYDKRYLTSAPHKFLKDYIDQSIEK